jgi:hypothetical protein
MAQYLYKCKKNPKFFEMRSSNCINKVYIPNIIRFKLNSINSARLPPLSEQHSLATSKIIKDSLYNSELKPEKDSIKHKL